MIALFGLPLAGCGGASSTNSTTTADFGTLIGAGIQLLRSGNAGAAEQLFQQAIAKQPKDPVGYYNLGVAYQQDGKPRLALRQYRLATRHDPQYVPALYNEAVLFTARDKATAMFLYREVISIKPDSPTALLNLGLLEASVSGFERLAYGHLTKAIRLDPTLRAEVSGALMTHLRERASQEPAPKRRHSGK
jgi:tetratricopeptide (TPR) repeat protein